MKSIKSNQLSLMKKKFKRIKLGGHIRSLSLMIMSFEELNESMKRL